MSEDTGILKFSVPRAYTKKGAPPCGLYWVTPPQATILPLVEKLRAAFTVINASSYEKNAHILEFNMPEEEDDEEEARNAEILLALCRHNGVVFIVNGDVDLAARIGADGVYLEEWDEEIVEGCRELLGEEAIIGVDCQSSQELAKAAHACQVDFVRFPVPSSEYGLIEWWKHYSVIPCVVAQDEEEPDTNVLVKMGVDFLSCSPALWNNPPEEITKAVKVINSIIEAHLDLKTLH